MPSQLELRAAHGMAPDLSDSTFWLTDGLPGAVAGAGQLALPAALWALPASVPGRFPGRLPIPRHGRCPRSPPAY